MPETTRTRSGGHIALGRRAALATLGAAALLAGLASAPPALAQDLEPLEVSVGRQPWAAGNSPIWWPWSATP